MDGIEIRATAPEEYRIASATVSAALMQAPTDDENWAKPGRVASWEGSDSLSAWDGDRCVGHVAGYRFDTLVPGGAWLPTNGVTRVGVLSTHRRRGVMRELIVRLLAEAAARGQVLASLRASETRIYQRFGFGLAGRSAEATITSRDALPISGAARWRVDAPARSRRDPRRRSPPSTTESPGVLASSRVRRGCGSATSKRPSSSAATPSSSPCTRPPTGSTTGSSTTA